MPACLQRAMQQGLHFWIAMRNLCSLLSLLSLFLSLEILLLFFGSKLFISLERLWVVCVVCSSSKRLQGRGKQALIKRPNHREVLLPYMMEYRLDGMYVWMRVEVKSRAYNWETVLIPRGDIPSFFVCPLNGNKKI
jgi:hypothetical protein